MYPTQIEAGYTRKVHPEHSLKTNRKTTSVIRILRCVYTRNSRSLSLLARAVYIHIATFFSKSTDLEIKMY